ncbi:hypothetical protein SAMN05444280_101241 [Tangfeifania diversioriginum]|jgi:hypothetical protein|uniref:Uncharacterized protein n=1 Tax=Tangfeifania diversioriginum TaxID=1168035 RepID=A0A1M6AKV9_9BACT|nr:hypothetical protein [Tangfeifania diversioriginum]SHI37102.1 hypothetical protein SAMN05444280_101241 [Tangfeifania diversioriginum]
MPTLTGTYFRGKLKLDKPVKFSKPVKVTVSFEEENNDVLTFSDFSFLETQELLKDCKTSFSDEVIEERREAI